MDSATATRGTATGRRLVGAFLWLALCSQIWAQDFSQIEFFAQSAPIEEGRRFNLYIHLPRELQDRLIVRRPENTDRYRYWSGPAYLYNSDEIDLSDDDFLVRYTFSADVAGYTEFPGFTLVWPGEQYETGPLLLPITADGERVPPELEWNLPQGRIYEGQTVYLSLDMHRVKEIVFPESLSVESARDGILEEVTGLGELSEYEYAGQKFNRIPLATFLYTPLTSGTLSIPSARVNFSDYTRSVRAASIEVRSLPVNASLESAAVGDFLLETSALPETLTEGVEFEFALTMRGQGSLGVIQLPDIEVTNATVEGRDQIDDYRPTENGYSGYQRRNYRIRPDAPGMMQISVPEYSWFNPRIGQMHTQPARVYTIAVVAAQAAEEEGPGFMELEYPVAKGLFAYLPLYIGRSWIGIAFFAAVPLYLLLFFAISRKWSAANRRGFFVYLAISAAICLQIASNMGSSTPEPERNAAFLQRASALIARWDEPDWIPSQDELLSQTIEDGNELLVQHPRTSRLAFTLAQLEYLQGKRAKALQLLRHALAYEPMNAFIRRAMDILQADMELGRQYGITRLPHEDWAVLMFFLCFLFSAIGLAAIDFSPQWTGGFVVACALFVVLFGAGGTMYVLYQQNSAQEVSVVKEGGVMVKRIPDADADNWVYLSEGTTVIEKVENNGFVQVQTAYGIVAWVPQDRVYP